MRFSLEDLEYVESNYPRLFKTFPPTTKHGKKIKTHRFMAKPIVILEALSKVPEGAYVLFAVNGGSATASFDAVVNNVTVSFEEVAPWEVVRVDL